MLVCVWISRADTLLFDARELKVSRSVLIDWMIDASVMMLCRMQMKRPDREKS